jgi:hypothetical protein
MAVILRIEIYNHLLLSHAMAGNNNNPNVVHACLKS